MSGPHGGIGHPGPGAGAFRMHRSAAFSGYRGPGVPTGPATFSVTVAAVLQASTPTNGGYYSYGYGGCAWLYAQAVASGSGYWWQRYYDCVGYWVIISQYRRARKPAVNRPPERASVSRS